MATPEQFLEVVTNRYMALQDAINSQFGADNAIGLVPDRGAAPDDYVLSAAGLWVPQSSISPGSVTNADLADMAQSTIKGRAAGAGTGSPQDLTATQATAILNGFTGDSGSGGVKGLVPAPSAGDAAANKFLNADGTFKATNQGLTLLTSGNTSSASSLDLVLTSYTAYRGIRIVLQNLVPVTDATFLNILFSTDGGTSWLGSNYNYAFWMIADNAGNVSIAGSAQAQIRATSTNANCLLSNAAGEGYSAEFELIAQTNTSYYPKMYGKIAYFSSNAFGTYCYGGGMNEATNDVDAIRFIISSGNISTVDYAVYGFN